MNFHASPPMRRVFTYLSASFLMTAGVHIHAQPIDKRSFTDSIGIRFRDFLTQVTSEPDSSRRQAIVDAYIFRVRAYGREVTEDSTVYVLFRGNARRVLLAGDINGWELKDSLTRVPKTDLFFLAKTLDPAARFEYKFVVDSVWMLDPMNPRAAIGGYGPNSEIWMPQYTPPKEIEPRSGIPLGRLDTFTIRSKVLRRQHPVIVYVPSSYSTFPRKRYPTIFVTDGGEYLSLAFMKNVLDNCIADAKIAPVIAVFVDPRTDMRDARTSKRMTDYSMSDTFVNFIVNEVRGRLMKNYRVSNNPAQTAIMGASLGGLIATYAAFTRPDVFGLCAAQSPSYWWKKKEMIAQVKSGKRRDIRFYIDTGTIRDARAEASEMRDVLRQKGYQVHYEEHPEGHNWVNWRARLALILTYFWGPK